MNKFLKLSGIICLASANLCGESTTVPKPEVFLSAPLHTFELQVGALYLQPTGSNLHYAAEAFPLPLPSPHWEIHSIDTDYHFGFEIGLNGIFHSTNTGLGINWEHFHSTDSSSRQVPSENMIGPFFEIGPDASPYKMAKGKAHFEFDAINLDYGIFINFGDRLQATLCSGISLARIKQTLTSEFSNYEETVVRSIKVPSTFTGAGPQVGLDFSYQISRGFHFTGGTALSLLVGTQKKSYDL